MSDWTSALQAGFDHSDLAMQIISCLWWQHGFDQIVDTNLLPDSQF